MVSVGKSREPRIYTYNPSGLGGERQCIFSTYGYIRPKLHPLQVAIRVIVEVLPYNILQQPVSERRIVLYRTKN